MRDARRGLGSVTLWLASFALAGTCVAQKGPNWPQWRGPDRDGIAKDGMFDPKAAGKAMWMTFVGLGYSTVSVVDGKVYTVGHDREKGEDTIFCIDAETGLEDWTHTFACDTMARAHRGGSLSTPSVAGGRCYVLDREGKAYCLDAKTGKPIWTKDLKSEHNLRIPQWGFAASPLILDEMIVICCGYVFAFDKDGKEIWRSERNYKTSYATPVDAKLYGKSCLATFNGGGLVVLERKTGKEVASHEWPMRTEVHAATPVVTGDKVFISSGYNTGCAMLEAKDGKFDVLWENREMKNQMSGCVLYEGHLYGIDDGGGLKCLDLEGNVKWSQRDTGKGAMVLADGKLVVLTARGDLVIANADPEKYDEVARQKALSGGVYWTTPVVCGGRVYCRNSDGDLACFDYRKKG